MVAPFWSIGKNTLLSEELLTITIFLSGGGLGTTAEALPAKPRTRRKSTDTTVHDVFINRSLPRELDPGRDGEGGLGCHRRLLYFLAAGCSIRATAACRELNPSAPSSALRKANRRNEKRIYLGSAPTQAGKPARARGPQRRPFLVLTCEGEIEQRRWSEWHTEGKPRNNIPEAAGRQRPIANSSGYGLIRQLCWERPDAQLRVLVFSTAS